MRNDSSSDVAASEAEAEAEDDRSITAVADEPAVTRERAPEVKPGDVLAGRYQIEAAIGKGGSGVVMRAFDRVSATVVALKVLKPGLTHDPRWEKRFQRELRLGRPIRHPNVCRIFDIGDADGYRFLTMEFATGGTLRDLIKKNQPLRPLGERLGDAAGVIAGLAAIHGAGIVHRDVKPDNMLRMEDGRLVLSDFGLATDLPDSTMVSVFVGTPHYMAPEVREGDPATTRSDVWSLGVALHEIFFGRRPEKRTARSLSGISKMSTTITPSKIERAMLALCERCLSDDPAERPADAAAVEKLFDRARTTPLALLRSRRRKTGVLIAAAAVLVASLGAMGWQIGRHRASSVPSDLPGLTRVVPTGQPANWSKSAIGVASFPERVHCFSLVDGRTVRVVWGKPRRAEDVDLFSGLRRPVALLPETYAMGCPQLALDGSGLLFTAATTEGAAEVRFSRQRDGSESRSLTPGADPVWLKNSREFLYDIDASHAAVFSLSTMGFVLLPDPGLGGHQMIADKVVSGHGDVAALLFVGEDAQMAVAVYEGVGFDRRRTFLVPPSRHLAFDGHGDRILIPGNPSSSVSTLSSLEWRAGTSTQLGYLEGLEIAEVRAADRVMAVRGRRLWSDVWLYEGATKRKLTSDGQNFSAAQSPSGDLLLSKQASDGSFSIWRQDKNELLERVTSGPNDVMPDFSSDGRSWVYVDYLNKSIRLCKGTSSDCRVLTRDDMLPAWPRFSPDGDSIAYVTQIGTPRLMVVSIRDGQAQPIGPMHCQCAPIWASSTAIWSFEGPAGHRHWIERRTSTGETTGRRIDVAAAVDSECWPVSSEPDSPFYRHLKVETEETSQLLRL
jgi:serine/threonine-protein kinase